MQLLEVFDALAMLAPALDGPVRRPLRPFGRPF
jgi:hypothetical protein